MKAKDVMRPADVILHVEDTVHIALLQFRQSGCERLLVIDGEEIVGHIGRKEAAGIDPQVCGTRSEMVGNIMDPQMKSCRPDDLVADLVEIFHCSPADIIAVVDLRQRPQGWIAREDILPTVACEKPH